MISTFGWKIVPHGRMKGILMVFCKDSWSLPDSTWGSLPWVSLWSWKHTSRGRHVFSVSSVQSLSHVRFFVTPWTAASQASLSITNSCSPPKPMSIELVIPSNHLILCRPLLLLPSIFPRIKVFSNESVLCIRWLKYGSFTFSISPSNQYSGLISFKMDW